MNYVWFLVLLFVACVTKRFNATEKEIDIAVGECLKHAPGRKDGGEKN